MASIEQVKASDGSGNANVATIQSSRSSGATTIIVDTVVGINPDGFIGSMGTPHTFTDPITDETITVISEATAVDFSGHVDGSNLEIDGIAPGYVDNGSEVGDIVIIRPTTQWSDNVADVLGVAHDDDGTLKDGAVDSATVLASDVVTTAKILDDAVTAAKLDGIDKSLLTTDSNPYKFFAYLNATANLSITYQIMPFDAELYDTNNNFNLTTHLYTVPVNGFYYLHAIAQVFDLLDQAVSDIYLVKNGSTALVYSSVSSSGAHSTSNQISGTFQLVAGDTMALWVTNSVGTRNWYGLVANSVNTTYFDGFLVSRT